MNSTLVNALLISAALFTGCKMPIRSNQTPFFSQFSIRNLVARNRSHFPLNCYSGSTAVGSGGQTKVFGTEIFDLSKTESYVCMVESGSVEQFDEANFLAQVKEAVEQDLLKSGTEITGRGGGLGNSFTLKYQMAEVKGQVDIIGRKVEHNSYQLEARVKEHHPDKAK